MHCIHINLDRQTGRRAFVEHNFDRNVDPGWTLHRFPAIDASNLPARFATGELRDAEKACFASHVGALDRALELPGDAMIPENDVRFGPRSAELVSEARGVPGRLRRCPVRMRRRRDRGLRAGARVPALADVSPEMTASAAHAGITPNDSNLPGSIP